MFIQSIKICKTKLTLDLNKSKFLLINTKYSNIFYVQLRFKIQMSISQKCCFKKFYKNFILFKKLKYFLEEVRF